GAARLETNLYKLIPVLRVDNLASAAAVFRDLAIIKVATTAETRAAVMQVANVFRARIVDVAVDSLVLESTGAEDKIDGLIEVLRGYGILEMARTGRVAMRRGNQVAVAAQRRGVQREDDQELACSV